MIEGVDLYPCPSCDRMLVTTDVKLTKDEAENYSYIVEQIITSNAVLKSSNLLKLDLKDEDLYIFTRALVDSMSEAAFTQSAMKRQIEDMYHLPHDIEWFVYDEQIIVHKDELDEFNRRRKELSKEIQ